MGLRRIVAAIHPRRVLQYGPTIDEAETAASALQSEIESLRADLGAMTAELAEARRRSDEAWESCRQSVAGRAALARLPHARLLSDTVVLDGAPSQRMRIRRVQAGEPVQRPFSRWLGLTSAATTSSDVRALWDQLLAYEAACADDVLRGSSSTILEIAGGTVSLASPASLRVSMRDSDAPPMRDHQSDTFPVLAVPRCAYALPPRKLRNFGHWLLDCVPHVVALSMVAPDAAFLLPAPLKQFQRSTLALAGVRPEQMIAWDGARVGGRRLLVLESDGRAGGGRPLSPLIEMRRRLAPAAPVASRTRRIYVSRRDARADRQWVANESAVEALFASRGFEVLAMEGCPLEDQVRIFREAAVVAGVSGAGLTNIIFSAPRTHVVVLVTDSLIRWYAQDAGARSLWASGERTRDGQLSALGDSPRFHVHLAAAYEQYCHTFVSGDEVPTDTLAPFLDEVLERVEIG